MPPALGSNGPLIFGQTCQRFQLMLRPETVSGQDSICGCKLPGKISHRNERGSKLYVAINCRRLFDFGAAAEKSEKGAVGQVVRGSSVQNPAEFPGRVLKAVAHGERDPSLEATHVVVHASLEILCVHAFSPTVAKFLLQCTAAKIEPGAVEVEAAHVQAGHPDHDGRPVGQLAKEIVGAQRDVG